KVDGITVAVDGAQARALVPGPVGAIDPRIRRLQIGGTDLEADAPGPVDPELPVLWLDSGVGVTVGKAAAQVGHARKVPAGALSVEQVFRWAGHGYRCSVREAGPRWPELSRLVRAGSATAVRDAGFTEVAPGSMTVIAVPPGV